MTEIIQPIPARLKNIAVDGHVAGADQIIDDQKNKTQETINSEVDTALNSKANKSEMSIIEGAPGSPAEGKATITLKQGVSATVLTKHQDISGKANTSDVNTALSGKQDVISDLSTIRSGAAAGATAQQPATTLAGYGITDAYTKSETYTKEEVNGLVDTPHQEYVTVDAYASLPGTGSKDTIYRVSNYNGSMSQVDASVYSEYAWNGSQYVFLCVKSQIGEVFDISVYNNNAKYADLAAALNGGANIPQSLQKGGMSVKFIQSSDNKYVQFRYMSTSIAAADFTNVANWQNQDISSLNEISFGNLQENYLGYDNFELGYVLISSGNVINAGTDACGYAIYDVTGLKKIKITAGTNYSNPYYGFFSSLETIDSSTNLSLSEVHSGNTATEKTFNYVDVPSGAKALVVNYYESKNFAVFEQIRQIFNPNPRIDEKIDKIILGEVQMDTLPRRSFSTNYYLKADGTIGSIADNDYGYAVYDVRGLKNIKIIAATNYNNPYYGFFSSFDTISSYTRVESSELHSGSTITEKAFDTEVPSEAVCLIVNYQLGYTCSAAEPITEILNPNPSVSEKLGKIVLGDSRDVIIQPKSITLSQIINTSGNIVNAGSDGYGLSIYDLTKSITAKVKIHTAINYTSLYYAFYSSLETVSSSTLISISEIHSGSTPTEKTFTDIAIPEGAVALVINFLNNYGCYVANTVKEVLNPNKSVLTGKKWVCVGDSLTAINIRTTKHYFDYIREETAVNPVNFGYSGAGYARLAGDNHAFYQLVQSIPSDADLVTVFGSFNDLGSGLQIGTIDDNDTTTIAGCINKTIDNIQAIIPLVRLGIIAPTPWDTTRPDPDDTSSNDYKYVTLLKKICERRSIPFLNLWICSNLRPWDADFRAIAYSKDGGSGTHPDENGHALIAPMIRQFILSLI